MAQFTRKQPVVRHAGAIAVDPVAPATTTYEGGTGYTRTARSELFLLAVTHLHGKDNFYESGQSRFARFKDLFNKVMNEEGGPEWLALFIPWLRDEAGIRTAAVVAAVEYARNPDVDGRAVIHDTLIRGDEPAEALGYHLSTYGRKLPKAIKKGLADAARVIYDELTILKYDPQRAAVRPGDVIALTHPKPLDAHQDAVFTALLDRRHGRDPKEETLALLPKVVADMEGQHATWERAGGAGDLNWDRQIAEGMGVMALLRNLRNFDKADISYESVEQVKVVLANEQAIRGSRVFPLQFISAWQAVDSMRWGETIERGLELSLANVPALDGTTIVLWDTSGSMTWGGHGHDQSGPKLIPAGVFAAALAKRADNAVLYGYSNSEFFVPVGNSTSILRTVQEGAKHELAGGGTQTWRTVEQVVNRHPEATRVVIVTDEQAHDRIHKTKLDAILGQRTCHVLNVAGYQPASAPSERVVSFGGLNDRMFTAIKLAEQGLEENWPWEVTTTDETDSN